MLCGVSGEDPSLQASLSSFKTECLEPERSNRTRVFLIFSAASLPPSDAFVEDLAPFEDEDPKTGVDADDTWGACCPKELYLILVTGPKLPKVTSRMLSTSA